MVEIGKPAYQYRRAGRDAEDRPAPVPIHTLPDPAPAPRPETTPSCAPLLARIPNPDSPSPSSLADLPEPVDGAACESLEQETQHQEIDGLIATGKVPIVANLAVASLTVGLLWDGAISNFVLAVWLAGLTIILSARYIWFRDPPAATKGASKRWLRLFAAGSALTGVWWGMLTLNLHLDVSSDTSTILVMVAAGMSAGAAASYAIYPPAAFGFFAPLLLLLSSSFFAEADFKGLIMGAVALLYGGVLAKVVGNVGAWRQQLVEAGVRNRKMAEEMRIIADQSFAMENWFDNQGKLRWASPSAERITGYTPEELLAMEDFPAPIVHADDRATIATKMASAGRNRSTRETEFRLVRKDGTLRWGSVVSQPAFDDEGRLNGFRASVSDVTENHDLRERLREANSNLSIVTEYSHAWEVWVGPRGRLRWISPSVERITGYTADECYAMEDYPMPLVHPDDADHVKSMLNRTDRMTATRRFEFRARHKDGRTRHCMVDSQPVFDDRGEFMGIRVSITDITEIKTLQEELRETAHDLKVIADHSFAWETLISPEGKFIWMNRGGERVTGYTVDELMALGSPVAIMHEDDKEQVRDIIRKRQHDDSLLEYQARIRRKDGEMRWIQVEAVGAFDADGEQVGFRSSVRDITELKELQAEVKKQTEELRIITDFSQAWETWFDNDGSLRWVSPSVERITGYRPDECYAMEGFPVPTIHPDDREKISKGLKAAAVKETYKEIEFRQLHKDGSIRWCAVESRPAFDANGKPVGFRSSVRDISRQKALQQELERIATTDSLTGIMNRRQFFHLGDAEIYRASRYRTPMSVVMLDVDHFKKINDTHGHGVGDECLKALAKCVTSTIRRSDFFARLGGEEFAILMPETGIEDAAALAERVRLAVQKINVPLPAGRCHFTISAGVSVHEPGTTDLSQLLQNADEALYEAKDAGRNRVRVAHPDGALGPDLMAAE
jgi:diguanylate cyclase (GGDEF)-like protein/PAS domain S-box-containing protein